MVLANFETDFSLLLASGPPLAAHARPSGLKRHSRREETFKEGIGILGGKYFHFFISKCENFIFSQSSLGHGESIGTDGFKARVEADRKV